MAQHAVRMVQRVTTPGGDKNGADINLALDALEMAFTHSHINAFVIVGGDSDFITLVEKLKQYDRKVFVVGGRAFTSQVMQKNCTEFIAYENVVPDPSTGSGSSRAQSRDERGGRSAEAGKRRAPEEQAARQSIEQAVPLVKRALKVLTDREVTPQLGLLKSTLLQLDSSFSERDYGVGSFREFADKLAKHGLVSLKHQGRSTLVELPDSNPSTQESPQAETPSLAAHAANGGNGAGQAKAETLTELLEQPDSVPQPNASLGDGVALVRRVLAEATTAAAMADVSAPVQAVPSHRAAGFRRAQVRIDRRPDARLPEGWPPASRARSPGRPARVRERRIAARVGAARVGRRQSRERIGSRRSGRGQRRRPVVLDVVPEVIAAAVVDAQITTVVEEAAAAKPKRAAKARKTASPKKDTAKKPEHRRQALGTQA